MLVLSLPPSNDTALDIIERTLDVNDSVRKAAYRVLANKFPLQSLRYDCLLCSHLNMKVFNVF